MTSEVTEVVTQTYASAKAKVLKVFRQYLMTPGQMLCLANADLDSMKPTLEKMTQEGLIVRDAFKGAYSLTKEGYDEMKQA